MPPPPTPQMTPEEAVRSRQPGQRHPGPRRSHKIIIGQDGMIEQMLVCMFARGHCLTIGVPGLAKTLSDFDHFPGPGDAVQAAFSSRRT